MHPGTDPTLYQKEWEISAEEKFSLKETWIKILNSSQVKHCGRPQKVALISDRHSSHLALWYVYYASV
jgi:hypothetical protein